MSKKPAKKTPKKAPKKELPETILRCVSLIQEGKQFIPVILTFDVDAQEVINMRGMDAKMFSEACMDLENLFAEFVLDPVQRNNTNKIDEKTDAHFLEEFYKDE